MGLQLGGGQSFQFDNLGDSVEGEIIEVTEVQATDMDSGEPLFWDPAQTRPKMLPTITLATKLRDDANDTGERIIYLGGHRYTAVRKVTRVLNEGDWMKITFSSWSDREPAKKGFGKAKLYTAEYRVAPKGLTLDGGSSWTAPAAPKPVDQPPAPITSTAPAGRQLTPEQIEQLKALGINL